MYVKLKVTFEFYAPHYKLFSDDLQSIDKNGNKAFEKPNSIGAHLLLPALMCSLLSYFVQSSIAF